MCLYYLFFSPSVTVASNRRALNDTLFLPLNYSRHLILCVGIEEFPGCSFCLMLSTRFFHEDRDHILFSFAYLSLSTWRRQWQPTPVLLPGKSHGQRSLVGCSPWGREESDTTERLHFHALEKEMATHSSVLAWRIPGTGEPGGLPSTGSHRVGHDWRDLAAALSTPRWCSHSMSFYCWVDCRELVILNSRLPHLNLSTVCSREPWRGNWIHFCIFACLWANH